jgi:hypothetical protein
LILGRPKFAGDVGNAIVAHFYSLADANGNRQFLFLMNRLLFGNNLKWLRDKKIFPSRHGVCDHSRSVPEFNVPARVAVSKVSLIFAGAILKTIRC